MKQIVDRPPNLRRAYFESRYGQLHCRTAFPSTGGFDELTPLVGLHDAPGSSAALAPLLPLLGRDRSVYLPDLPGCGGSDSPPAPVTIAEYAAAIGEMLRGLRLREIDVLGVGAGAAVAVELALWFGGGVRRLALARLPGVPPGVAKPIVPTADGSHLLAEWQVGLIAGADAQETARHSREIGERLAGGASAQWPAAALAHWPLAATVSRLALPMLVQAHEPAAPSLKPLLPAARFETYPNAGDYAPGSLERNERSLRDFLDR